MNSLQCTRFVILCTLAARLLPLANSSRIRYVKKALPGEAPAPCRRRRNCEVHCPNAASLEWRKKGFEIYKDNALGHVYIMCSNDHKNKYKVSCIKKECNGAKWCFIKNGCGGAFNRCKKLSEEERNPKCSHVDSLVTSDGITERRLMLRLNRAALHRDTDTTTAMDPYVDIRMGTKVFRSPIMRGAGKHPQWRYEREIFWEGERRIRFIVMDLDSIGDDDVVGRATFDLASFAGEEHWSGDLHLKYNKGTEDAGTLNINLEWRMPYQLLQEGKICKASNLSMGAVAGLDECAKAVRTDGGKFFAFGTGGSGTKECFKEMTESSSCNEGWQSSSLSFYRLRKDDESKADGLCKKNTGGTCKLLSCAHSGENDRGEVDCIDQQCLCKEGFCVDGHFCKAACDSPAVSSREQLKMDQAVKILEAGRAVASSEALHSLSTMGAAASKYVDMIAKYLDYGLHWESDFKLMGDSWGASVAKLFEASFDAVGSGISWMGATAMELLGTHILTVIIGTSCIVNPFICMAVGAGAGLIGTGAKAVSLHLMKSRKDLVDKHYAMVRANASIALRHMGECGRHYVGGVVLQLGDKFPHMRLNALETLGEMHEAAAPYAAEIAVLLNDHEYRVRRKAESVLSMMGVEAGRRAASDLSALLADGICPLTQTLALRSLALLGKPATPHVKRVERLLLSTDLGVRQAAAQVMAAVGSAACPSACESLEKTLIRILSDEFEDEIVKGFIAVALSSMGKAEDKIDEVFPYGVPPVVKAETGMSKDVAAAQERATRAEKALSKLEEDAACATVMRQKGINGERSSPNSSLAELDGGEIGDNDESKATPNEKIKDDFPCEEDANCESGKCHPDGCLRSNSASCTLPEQCASQNCDDTEQCVEK